MAIGSGRVVLVVGNGGREHALAKRLARSASVGRVLVLPGNAGTAEASQNIDAPGGILVPAELVRLCEREGVGLAIIGPEAPLVAGLADDLRAAGIPTFGPSRAAAKLEGSKVFMKRFAADMGIPTAPFEVFTDVAKAARYIQGHPRPLVVKADGLCAGKGVVVASNADEAERAARAMLSGEAFGDAGRAIVVEDQVGGAEASIHAICDGSRYVLLPAVQDHKRIGEGDLGPNTGGMGAYGPTPLVASALERRIAEIAIEPVLRGLAERGTPFTGALFAGLMISDDGVPTVLEYNARFGDPETEVLMDLVDGDFGDVFAAAADSKLDPAMLVRSQRHAIAVVLAAHGYPGKPRTGDVIEGLADASRITGVNVLHAGTRREGDRVVTAGGRVLVVTATGATLAAARDLAYQGVDRIHFSGMQVRRDIAWRALS
ncbi:MAG TPA: phosphoribosylamine--glycine ligase [Polyangiaceae bacterium]|nr:phosphoribosylamine--glycine ligase [Polyangiaceae bacterium]